MSPRYSRLVVPYVRLGLKVPDENADPLEMLSSKSVSASARPLCFREMTVA